MKIRIKHIIIFFSILILIYLYFFFKNYLLMDSLRQQAIETEKLCDSIKNAIANKTKTDNLYSEIIKSTKHDFTENDKNIIIKKISGIARKNNVTIESINANDNINILTESLFFNICEFIETVENDGIKLIEFSIIRDTADEKKLNTYKVRTNMIIKQGMPDKIIFPEKLSTIIKDPFYLIVRNNNPDTSLDFIYKGTMSADNGKDIAVLQKSSDNRIIYAGAGEKVDNIIIEKIFYDRIEIKQNGKVKLMYIK